MSTPLEMQDMSPRSFTKDPIELVTPPPYQSQSRPYLCSDCAREEENAAKGVKRDIESQNRLPAARTPASDDTDNSKLNIFVTVLAFIVTYLASVFFPLLGQNFIDHPTDKPQDVATISPGFERSSAPNVKPARWPSPWLAPLFGCVIFYAILIPTVGIFQLLIRKYLARRATKVYRGTMLVACLPLAVFAMAVGIYVAPHDAGADFVGLSTGQVINAGLIGYGLVGIPLTGLVVLTYAYTGSASCGGC